MAKGPTGRPRGRPRKDRSLEVPESRGTPGFGHNQKPPVKQATAAQIAIAAHRGLELQSEMGRAAGRMGAHFKQVEDELGIDRRLLKRAMQDFKLTREQAMEEHKELTRYKVALNIIPPPADEAWTTSVVQGDLLAEVIPAAGAQAEMLRFTIAKSDGFKAAMKGKQTIDQCPHNQQTASAEFSGWREGFTEGDKFRKETKGEATPKASASRKRPEPEAETGDVEIANGQAGEGAPAVTAESISHDVAEEMERRIGDGDADFDEPVQTAAA